MHYNDSGITEFCVFFIFQFKEVAASSNFLFFGWGGVRGAVFMGEKRSDIHYIRGI